MHPSTSPDLMTPKEFASVFGVTQRTVYNWIAESRIAHFRIGGTVRIPTDEIAKAMRKKAEDCESYAI